MNYYGYVYKTINIINNKIYIGQHKVKNNKLDENYFGSGYLLRNAIKKYGQENFKCSIIEWANNKPELDEIERKYIKLYNSTDTSIGYNICIGGQGGDGGPIIREKISKALRGRPANTKGKIPAIGPNGKIKYFKSENSIPDDYVKGNTASGKIRINNGKKEKFIYITELPDMPIEWVVGCIPNSRIPTKEHLEKLAYASRHRDYSNYISPSRGKISINNGKVTKFINKNDPIPNGWKLGNCYTMGKHNMEKYYSNIEMVQHRKDISTGKNNPMYGKGYKLSGGKNGHAIYNYIFENITYDCRDNLMIVLKKRWPAISESTVRRIMNNSYGTCIKNKYQYVIDNLRWELKDENKKNQKNKA